MPAAIKQLLQRLLPVDLDKHIGINKAQGKILGEDYANGTLACAGHAVPVASTELFGPVLSIFSFNDEADAVAVANNTNYGLAAGIFTRDIGRGMRVMRQIRSGIVWINATNLFDKRWAAQITPSPVTTLNPGGYLQYFSPDSVRRVGASFQTRF